MALLIPGVAGAQMVSGNPFAEAAAYRSVRGALPAASQRFTYEISQAEPDKPKVTSNLVLDVADDWALVTAGDTHTLYDFKLGRLFVLEPDRFQSQDLQSGLVFRVMERQNRDFLRRVLVAGGIEKNFAEGCDSDTELGIALGEPAGGARIARKGGEATVTCGRRVIASLTFGKDAKPPAAFWPTMNAVMLTHPLIQTAARAHGAAPAKLVADFRRTGPKISHIEWRLVSAAPTATPYPLVETLRNDTAAVLDAKTASGVGTLAAEAIAGRAQGGAPTPQSWATHLRATFDKEGAVGVAMLLLPTANMFPQTFQQCGRGSMDTICSGVTTARASIASDVAPRALFTIALGAADSSKKPADGGASAVVAMQQAWATPQRNHPALGAAYALALVQFDEANVEKAKAAGLPTDPIALQVTAVKAIPYNPAYWLDLGDGFAREYDMQTATLLWDVALALPMSEAQAENVAVKGKRELLGRLRNDFPEARLP